MRWWFAIVLAACGRIGFEESTIVVGDGGGDDAPACSNFGSWTAGTRLDNLATSSKDWSPALHPSGALLVFESERDGDANLYSAPRVGTGLTFGTPTPIATLDTLDLEQSPAWSADGTQLYFSSDRTGAFEIWVSDFDGSSFGTPVQVGVLGNGPAIAPNNLELFYTSTIFPYDLRRAVRPSVGMPWVEDASAIAGLNSATVSEGYPAISGDGLTLYFETNPGGLDEIYEATRANPTAAFGPVMVTEPFHANGVNFDDPDISLDGTIMLFANDSMGSYDIYAATRPCL